MKTHRLTAIADKEDDLYIAECPERRISLA
jgi:hypothetical protein